MSMTGIKYYTPLCLKVFTKVPSTSVQDLSQLIGSCQLPPTRQVCWGTGCGQVSPV
jgi:hypothetical protein